MKKPNNINNSLTIRENEQDLNENPKHTDILGNKYKNPKADEKNTKPDENQSQDDQLRYDEYCDDNIVNCF